MTMTPHKTEIDAVAAILRAGGESPEAMAKDIIKAIYNDLLPERTVYVTAFDLGNSVWVGAGLYPSRLTAFQDAHKQPVAQVAKRALIAAVRGPGASATAKETESTGDWKLVREDAQNFKEGKRRGR